MMKVGVLVLGCLVQNGLALTTPGKRKVAPAGVNTKNSQKEKEEDFSKSSGRKPSFSGLSPSQVKPRKSISFPKIFKDGFKSAVKGQKLAVKPKPNQMPSPASSRPTTPNRHDIVADSMHSKSVEEKAEMMAQAAYMKMYQDMYPGGPQKYESMIRTSRHSKELRKSEEIAKAAYLKQFAEMHHGALRTSQEYRTGQVSIQAALHECKKRNLDEPKTVQVLQHVGLENYKENEGNEYEPQPLTEAHAEPPPTLHTTVRPPENSMSLEDYLVTGPMEKRKRRPSLEEYLNRTLIMNTYCDKRKMSKEYERLSRDFGFALPDSEDLVDEQ